MNPHGETKQAATWASFFLVILVVFPLCSLYAKTNDPTTLNATILEVIAPSAVVTGQTFSVSITVSNSGSAAWTKEFPDDSLGARNPDDNRLWRHHFRVHLPSEPVPPGDSVTFTFECSAPNVADMYPFDWQMVEGSYGWFGVPVRKKIRVVKTKIETESQPRPLHYTARLWHSEDGLPQNSVQALVQTADGYLWVGTQNGLARFDGMRFVTFNPKNTPALKSASIYALCETPDGSLWIGTFNGGLTRLRHGVFSHFGEKEGLMNDYIRSLLAGRDGSLWIGTTNGVARFHNERFFPVKLGETSPTGAVRTLGEEADGSVWIATDQTIHQIRNDRLVDPAPGEKERPGARALLFDRRNVLWAGTQVGLIKLNANRPSHFTKTDGLPDNLVSALHEDRHGNLWVGTFGGLCRRFEGEWMVEKAGDGSAFDTISAILEDREGNIWIGAKDGLTRLTVRSFTSYTQQHGLPHNNVMAVREDAQGALWISTWGGGLSRFKDDKFTTFDVNSGLSFNMLLGLCEDRAGYLWVGADYDGGLNRLNMRDHAITQFRSQQSVTDPAMRVVYEDRQGNLWLGSNRSLTRFRNGDYQRFTPEHGLAGNTVRVILEDREGNLWIGTNEGLSRMRDGKFTNFGAQNGLSSSTIISLHEDSAGDIWIGTVGGGLNRWRKEQFSSYQSKHGLASDDIHEILEDDFGRLWMSCRAGVFCVRKQDFDELDAGRLKTLSCSVFGKRDGLPSLECNAVAKPAGWKSQDGRLWFATAKGLAVVDPGIGIETNTKPPPVVIEEVIADKNKMSPLHNQISRDVTIPAGRGELEIHYTALSLKAPEKNQFKYKLEGFDPGWIEAGSRRAAYYNNLPPGEYTFHVSACNNDGVWNTVGSKVKLSLLPHFWQTWWFRGSLVAAGIAGVIGIVSLRRSRRRELEQLRVRIAGDLHDELGSNLSSIALLSRRVSKRVPMEDREKSEMDEISRIALQTTNSVRDIVWFINPENDTLDQMVQRMKEVAGIMLADLQFEFRSPASAGSDRVTPEFRRNLFLVFKETLNNIVQHSQCTCVEILLTREGNHLTMIIRDNGRGFDSQATQKRRGNGLKNLRLRIEQLEGRLEITSKLGEGTTVTLVVPVQ